MLFRKMSDDYVATVVEVHGIRGAIVSSRNNRGDANERPIDFVIPWVDGFDPEWLAERGRFETEEDRKDIWRASDIRYRSWDNLQYWFRGVEKFAPWVRKIHFVTWGHLPSWLDTSHPKLHIVRHEDYIPSKYLPTFSSHVIEWNFHRIEDLCEQFVYFNDDMFLLDKVKPTDFFVNGKPRDTFSMNAVSLPQTSTMCPPVYNASVLNRHFSKKDVVLRNATRLFDPRNGSDVFRTLFTLPWPNITGISEPHLPSDLLKSTYEELWELEPELLDRVCRHKFREPNDVNQWLVRDWQLCKGNFVMRPKKFGKRFTLTVGDEIVDCVENQRYKLVCFNDNATAESFEEEKSRLIAAFDHLLPEKSAFEV